MINYDSFKKPEVWFNSQMGEVFWVECEVCLYDGENGTEFTKEFALARLKEHNHYPLVDKHIQAIEKELG